jgi:uncharacterized membrane protein
MTTYLKLEKRCTLYYLRALFVVVYMWTLFHQSVKLFLNVRIWFINTRRWPSTIYNDNWNQFCWNCQSVDQTEECAGVQLNGYLIHQQQLSGEAGGRS